MCVSKMTNESVQILHEIKALLEDNKTQLRKLNNDIDKIKLSLLQTRENTQKMSTHIDFVEGIYTQIKLPMHYVIGRINKMRSVGALAISRFSFFESPKTSDLI